MWPHLKQYLRADLSGDFEPGGEKMASGSGDAMSRNTIYVDVGTVPYSVPEGRVLMHNQVLHDADTPSGTNGFRGWTDLKPLPGFVRCHCGWAYGLPHYARSDVAVAR